MTPNTQLRELNIQTFQTENMATDSTAPPAYESVLADESAPAYNTVPTYTRDLEHGAAVEREAEKTEDSTRS